MPEGELCYLGAGQGRWPGAPQRGQGGHPARVGSGTTLSPEPGLRI